MKGSWAFEAIDDPADPAWSGNVALHEQHDRRRRWLLVAAAGLAVVAALVVVAIVVRGGSDDDRAASVESARAAGASAPLEQSGAATEVPQLDQLDVAPADRTTGSGDGASSDASGPRVDPSAGSGWAPPQVTHAAYSPEHITGDTSGIAAVLMSHLDALAADLGQPIEIVSGWRTRHEQSQLYQQYLAGTGNLAAVPGTSLHEVGRAADVYVDGTPLASVPGAIELARAHGLHFPVHGEAWHVELIGDPLGSGR